MAAPVPEARFTPDTIVADALAMHPDARWIFAAHQLSGCTTCASAAVETLEDAAEGYTVQLERLLADLNALAG